MAIFLLTLSAAAQMRTTSLLKLGNRSPMTLFAPWLWERESEAPDYEFC